jgi:hypothetical protein
MKNTGIIKKADTSIHTDRIAPMAASQYGIKIKAVNTKKSIRKRLRTDFLSK